METGKNRAPGGLRGLWLALRTSFKEWRQDSAMTLASSLAFSTVFSIAPLLVIVIAIAGRVFGGDAVRGQIVSQFGGLIGHGAADQLQTMIQSASNPKRSAIASILGIAALLLGAMGVFGQLKSALNTVWKAVPTRRSGILNYIRNNLLSLAMVLGVAFLLLVSLVLTAALAAVSLWLGGYLPEGLLPFFHVVNGLLSFLLVTVLFAMIYKVLPDLKIDWKDVWIGAAATSLLFNGGKLLIGLYLGRSSFTSVYGAAGSFVVILLWIYYSSSIFLYGAEFTQVYARFWGSRSGGTGAGTGAGSEGGGGGGGGGVPGPGARPATAPAEVRRPSRGGRTRARRGTSRPPAGSARTPRARP